jgi:hypothetical protein
MPKKKRLSCSALLLFIFLCAGIIFGSGILWIKFRPQPAPTQEMLFQGVEYIRDVRSSPRPMVIHVIKIDLKADGIHTLVTPGDPQAELPLTARTTSQFLDDFNVQVAINGDAFDPWVSNSLWDYYPHSGDPVDVIGYAASKGESYSAGVNPVLYFARNNNARFNQPFNNPYNAISGNAMLVKNGKALQNFIENGPQPRTAVALNRSERTLILIVIDGRQPGYSMGATLAELAEIVVFHGGYTAMNLDGGGSSTLVVEGLFGAADVLNTPIDQNIPGRQRPVGNHLGIYARALGE